MNVPARSSMRLRVAVAAGAITGFMALLLGLLLRLQPLGADGSAGSELGPHMLRFLPLALAAALTGGALLWFALRPLVRRVQHMADGAISIAEGNLEARVRDDGHDELSVLSNSLNAMADSLIRSRQQALEASRAKSRFLATMSHEIRTPMNGVVGATELLLGTELTEEQESCARTVHDSARVLLGVLNDILDFSKIEAGGLQLEAMEIDLRKLVEDVAEIFALPAQNKLIELVCQLDVAAPRRIVVDPVRLRQVLMNLVGNAVKFTNGGEIVLRVAHEREPQGRNILRCSVADTGIGIPDAVCQRIFEPFSQADDSTTRRFGGTGLGLAIVRQLVEAMGGKIAVQSEPGQGTTFSFSVEVGVPVEAEPPSPETGGGASVLLAARSVALRAALVQILAAHGYRVREAADGAEAVYQLRRAELDGAPCTVAIVEHDLPAFWTPEQLRMLVTGSPLDEMPLVLLAPLARVAATPGICARGVVLAKPVRTAALLDAIARSQGARPAEIDGEPAAAPEPTAVGGRILVAEDNSVNLRIVSKILEKAGYEVDAARNGLEAVQKVEANAYDLVLMDCEMPELDGYQATRCIRGKENEREEQAPRLPIIALTANALEGDRQRCLDAGMDGYCSKPVSTQLLLETIARHIEHARAERESRPVPVS